MNTTGPLEILVMIVLLLVVVGCAIVCVVAVRWLRRIALQVEEDQITRRERDAAADEREAAVDAREAAAHERDAARRQAEHDAVLDLRQIQRRVALLEEELATVRVESAKAQTATAKAQAEAAQAQTEAAKAQAVSAEAQAAAARAQQEAVQGGARRATAPAVPDRGDSDEGGSLPAIEDADLVRDVLRRFVGDGLDERRDDGLGGVDDLSSGDLAAILRRLGLPTMWGDGNAADDVSVKGIDPRLLRRLHDLIPPEVMRRLTSGRGPGDIESIGDWIRSQIEKSMDDGHDSAAGGGSGRGGAGRGSSGRRPAGFQRDDSSVDRSDAVNDSEVESDDLSDVLPDALTDSGDVPEADSVTASPGGLDVSALIEEALRDRARRRSEETPDTDSDGEPGDNDTPPEPDED